MRALAKRALEFIGILGTLQRIRGALRLRFASPSRRIPSPSLESLLQANLDAVADTLAAEGISYFLQRNRSPNRHVVGVPAASRHRLLAALAKADPALMISLTGRDEDALRVSRVTKRPLTLRKHLTAPAWRVFHRWSVPGSSIVLGANHGCGVEFWSERKKHLKTEGYQWIASSFSRAHVRPTSMTLGEREYPSFDVFTDIDHVDDITFPIDLVYTWVDDSDPAWRKRMTAARAAAGTAPPDDSAGPAKFRNRDELRFSMRSASMFAPWYRHIYLVTDSQVPEWLDVSHPDITVIDHTDIFEPRHLPTFNSDAIQAVLHEIPGLAEHFIYLNDDIFFGRPVSPDLFFAANGALRFYPSRFQVAPGPISAHDPVIDAAAKNVRDTIAGRFGRRVTHKIRHHPYPVRRSLMQELEAEFPDIFERVRGSRFRSPDGMAVTCALAYYYAYLTGQALPGEVSRDLKYEYFDLSLPETLDELDAFAGQWTKDTFCLNDTPGDTIGDHHIDAFLAEHLPIPAPWERPEFIDPVWQA
jgi:hypothetical protein